MTDYEAILKRLVSEDVQEQEAARRLLFVLDEDAVAPLIDAFYAGVSEKTGLAILEVLMVIGGFEAMALFCDVAEFDARYNSWRRAAQHGIEHNT